MFFNLFRAGGDTLGVVEVPPEFTNDSLPPTGRVGDWSRPTLRLSAGGFTDALSANLIWNIFSDRFRSIVVKVVGSEDGCQWLPVNVCNDAGVFKSYFLLHLPEVADVLDRERSVFVGTGRLAKPCIDSGKARGRHVFKIRPTNVGLIVSEEVKDAVQVAGCTGMQFSAVLEA